jgi:hypothetical protein
MFKRILPTAVAIAVGLIVLVGSFLPNPQLFQIRLILIQWAVVLAAFAFVIAFFNLLRVHFIRIGRRRKGAVSSLLVVLSALGSFGLVMWQGRDGEYARLLLDALIVPGETALLALTGITLVVAGMRLMRERRSVEGGLFLVTAIVVLLGSVPYIGQLGALASWVRWVPALAGMRGLLLGVVLGITLTGLRILFGATRPHSED